MCIYHMTHAVCTQYIFNEEAGKKESRVGEWESSDSLPEGRGEERGERGRGGERALTMRVAECRRSHLGSGSR